MNTAVKDVRLAKFNRRKAVNSIALALSKLLLARLKKGEGKKA